MGLLKTLLELVGILMVIGGVIFIAVGAYGLAGGSGITFTINDRLVTAEEGGQIFSVVGAVVLLVGVALTYIGFRRMK